MAHEEPRGRSLHMTYCRQCAREKGLSRPVTVCIQTSLFGNKLLGVGFTTPHLPITDDEPVTSSRAGLPQFPYSQRRQ